MRTRPAASPVWLRSAPLVHSLILCFVHVSCSASRPDEIPVLDGASDGGASPGPESVRVEATDASVVSTLDGAVSSMNDQSASAPRGQEMHEDASAGAPKDGASEEVPEASVEASVEAAKDAAADGGPEDANDQGEPVQACWLDEACYGSAEEVCFPFDPSASDLLATGCEPELCLDSLQYFGAEPAKPKIQSRDGSVHIEDTWTTTIYYLDFADALLKETNIDSAALRRHFIDLQVMPWVAYRDHADYQWVHVKDAAKLDILDYEDGELRVGLEEALEPRYVDDPEVQCVRGAAIPTGAPRPGCRCGYGPGTVPLIFQTSIPIAQWPEPL